MSETLQPLPIIPPEIENFLVRYNLGTVEIDELNVYTVMQCTETKKMYINTAVVLDNDGVVFKWTYDKEMFKILVQDDLHGVYTSLKLIDTDAD